MNLLVVVTAVGLAVAYVVSIYPKCENGLGGFRFWIVAVLAEQNRISRNAGVLTLPILVL